MDQEKILRFARAMARSGLVDHGWSYINIDDTWQGARDPTTHALQPNQKFPDLRALADTVHGLGLKLGIYSTPWITSYATFAGIMLKSIGLSSVGVTWFWVMYGASSIAGSALGAVLLSGGFARRIALSAALGSGAIGSLLFVHGGNWSVFAASVLVGLGSVATPAIVTFLIRNRTSDAAYPFLFTVGTASLGLGQLSGPVVGGLLADWFGFIGDRLVGCCDLRRRHACCRGRRLFRPDTTHNNDQREGGSSCPICTLIYPAPIPSR